MFFDYFRRRSKSPKTPSEASSSSSLPLSSSSSSSGSRPRYTAANPLEGTRYTSITRRDQEKLAAQHDRLQQRLTQGSGYYKWKPMTSRQAMKKDEHMISKRQMNSNKTVNFFRDVQW